MGAEKNRYYQHSIQKTIIYTWFGKDNKIILSADFLASLSCGKHTLTVKTSIGTASCDFYISENGETVAPNNKSVSPKTADNGNYVLIPVALISALFLGIMLLGRKRITE